MNGFERRVLNWKVRNKVFFGYGTIVFFMVLVAVIATLQTSAIGRLSDESQRSSELRLAGEELGLALADRTAAFRDYMLTGQDTALLAFNEANTRLSGSLNRANELVVDSLQRERLRTIADLAESWQIEAAVPGINLRKASLQPGGPSLEAVLTFARSGDGRRGSFRARDVLREFQAQQKVLTGNLQARQTALTNRIEAVTLIATLVALVLGLLVAVWIARLISGRLNQAVDFTAGVAKGDLRQELPVQGHDEVGVLAGTLNRMTADLRDIIGRVGSAAVQVASASDQIAATSSLMSNTTDEQVRATEETSSSMEQIAAQIARVAGSTESLAASVEQTSASIGEIGQSIEQTAMNAESLGTSVEETSATIEQMVVSITQVGRDVQETREIARGAQKDARAGGDAVERTSAAMQRIHEETEKLVRAIKTLGTRSESIGQVSRVIEDIADQTNLLALNAAIEAARAGEHGRGFAVVAQEIRRLAERAVESTREIGNTIREVRTDVSRAVDSTGGVADSTGEGLQLAEGAAAALRKIIESAARTRDLMEEVGQATEQQITAAEQAQAAIRHIQSVAEEVRIATREQVHGSRQIVEATENMNRQTQEVFAATAEQKRGGELILQSTESISAGAREMQGAVSEVVTAASDLSGQASRLTEMIQEFRV